MTRQEIEQLADERYPTAKDYDSSLTTMAEMKGWIAGFTEGLIMNHWHSVADGDCPKWLKGDAEDMPFVVISKGGNQLFAYYDEDEDGVCDFYDDCDCPLDVVYWMEIPQLPKEGDAK